MTPVPASFPRGRQLGALAGAQAKFPVRQVEGKYVGNEPTDKEIAERYDICLDLVQQLIPYCARKRKEHPEWAEAELAHKLAAGIKAKCWDFSPDEVAWMIASAVEPQAHASQDESDARDAESKEAS